MSIRQGHEITGAMIESADVCVIGSGCGGASLACRLAEAGLDVVILERGGYYTKEDFDQREVNMLPKIDGGRGLSTSDDLGILMSYGGNVGGASVHYWADTYRTPDDRLEAWANEHGIEGHRTADLMPHFEQIERDLGVNWADDRHANALNLAFREGAKKLDWSWERVPQARRGCASSGYCMQGCAYDAKQSQLVTYIPRAIEAGARLYADCEATELMRSGSKVLGVKARFVDRARKRPAGPTLEVRAKATVVATGGFATGGFLLKQNLRKTHPAVGEYFHCNPCPSTYAMFEESMRMWRSIPAAFSVKTFRRARYDGETYREGGYLLMPNQLHPASLAALLPGFGEAHTSWMSQLDRVGGVISWIDDVEFGRIYLDGDRVRHHVPLRGQNLLRIRDAWRKQSTLLFEMGARQVQFGDVHRTTISRPDEIDAAVAGLNVAPGQAIFAAPHPSGGARMGPDISSSVVGSDHRVHEFDNLYVSDPSVFPSSVSVDPSLTIMAFAFVAADHIRDAIG